MNHSVENDRVFSDQVISAFMVRKWLNTEHTQKVFWRNAFLLSWKHIREMDDTSHLIQVKQFKLLWLRVKKKKKSKQLSLVKNVSLVCSSSSAGGGLVPISFTVCDIWQPLCHWTGAVGIYTKRVTAYGGFICLSRDASSSVFSEWIACKWDSGRGGAIGKKKCFENCYSTPEKPRDILKDHKLLPNNSFLKQCFENETESRD